ncbi:hypothetical protein C8R43DRAFT_827424, partial [Mycena crocata]
YCFKNDLSQVWAYMWNWWYCSSQWPLWTRVTCEAIPRLKMTMVVESMWKHIKRRNLAQFKHPRFDLVLYLVIIGLLPRVLQTLAYCSKLNRSNRHGHDEGDFKATWVNMSRPDDIQLAEKQLKWLRTPQNTRGQEEHLQLLQAAETRDPGTYATDITKWVCPCPAFPKTHFLTCKHLVREA